jgi:hypothetical protein
LLALLALMLCVGLAAAPRAGADVTEVNRTCATYNSPVGIPPYQITLTKPAGVAAGDLMIATTRYSAFYSAVSTPTGWTELQGNGQNSTSWYRIAAAGDPASWNFTAPSGPGSGVGGITAFTGVNQASPFAGTSPYGTMLASSPAATFTLPNDVGTVAGSMRFSSVVNGAAVTNTFAGMTEGCDQTQGAMSYSSAWEPTGAGTTTSRTDARSGGTNAQVSFTFVINPAGACSTGGLNLTPPGAVTFPATVLNGLDKQLSPTGPVTATVDDETGTASGWSLSGTSTTFTAPSGTLPTNSTSLLAVSSTAATGNCTMPTSSVAYPVTPPAPGRAR